MIPRMTVAQAWSGLRDAMPREIDERILRSCFYAGADIMLASFCDMFIYAQQNKSSAEDMHEVIQSWRDECTQACELFRATNDHESS